VLAAGRILDGRILEGDVCGRGKDRSWLGKGECDLVVAFTAVVDSRETGKAVVVDNDEYLDDETLSGDAFWIGPGFAVEGKLAKVVSSNLAEAQESIYAGEEIAKSSDDGRRKGV
jgi:hypothetical protein